MMPQALAVPSPISLIKPMHVDPPWSCGGVLLLSRVALYRLEFMWYANPGAPFDFTELTHLTL